MNKFKLSTIQDFADLSPEQFARMLPDFLVWHSFHHEETKLYASSVGFTWIDDGHSGQIHSVEIFETGTGNRYTLHGPLSKDLKGGAK